MDDIPALLPAPERERLASGQCVTTTVDGPCRIVWHDWPPAGQGAARRRPVVLLHGGGGSWTHWARNILPLADSGRRVLAVDLPGMGQSGLPPGGTDADALVEPLAAGLQALLDGERADVAGFSFGGMTAGLLLAAHPELAARLVLVGAPAMGVTPERQFQLKGWRHLPTAGEQAAIHRHNLGELMLHDHGLIDGLALQLHIANVPRDRMPRRRLARTDILARLLPRLRCPVHAIYGEHDALYRQYIHQLEDAFAAAAADFRGLKLIEGAGHWVQFEAPEAFDAALLAALDSPL
jgi:pimeloyl-ACP methyl ester carboxylesterase